MRSLYRDGVGKLTSLRRTLVSSFLNSNAVSKGTRAVKHLCSDKILKFFRSGRKTVLFRYVVTREGLWHNCYTVSENPLAAGTAYRAGHVPVCY